ncbi:MAG: PQQ-dependent sugar dehydrogenase [Chloroflexota bacterium]|nr:PQQ-dependent sugar dehydrogenase [Ardenticatenaceae bacterium]
MRTIKYLGLFVCLVVVTGFIGVWFGGDVAAETAVSADIADTSMVYLPAIMVPPAPPIVQVELFAAGFDTDTITDIAHANDNRLFVVEREGRIRIVNQDGTILPEPFLDISSEVSTYNWEQGLVGLVFHPNYPQTPYFYISYTASTANRIRIERISVDPAHPNRADVDSRVLLMSINKTWHDEHWSPVHNAGDMTFGPDGYLYIAIGDGGPDPATESTPGDPYNHGQWLFTLLGKILRINVNGGGLPSECGGTNNYTIPASNPYVNASQVCDEIWASGFRNPWRFSIDALTGDMFIGDVGEERFEEINYQSGETPGGRNFGWHCYEGTFDYTQLRPDYDAHCGEPSAYMFPVYEYDNPANCSSVVGGFVYRGSQYPTLYGRYLFADFCEGEFKTLTSDYAGGWTETTASDPDIPTSTLHGITTFGEDVNGELYAGKWVPSGTNNAIYRITVIEPTP